MANNYQQFFFKTVEGEAFRERLETAIAQIHRDSELHPENARDNAQKACGIREVMVIINVMSSEAKKGKKPAAEPVVS